MGIFRVLLAIAVLMGHSVPLLGLSFCGSAIAVQAFFIISGFYMSLILNEKYLNHKNYYKLFITNRFLKIFPAYWFVFIISVITSLLVYFFKGDALNLRFYFQNFTLLNFSSIIYFIFTNIFIFFQETTLFFGLNNNTHNFYITENFRNTSPLLWQGLVVPQAWTLSLELLFYLIAPFIIIQNKYKYRIWILLSLSLVLNVVLYLNGVSFDPWIRRIFPTQLFLFLAGYVSYIIYQKIKLQKKWNLIICIALLSCTIFYGNIIEFYGKHYLYLFLVMLGTPFVFNLTKTNNFDRRVGNLSYIIYILHIFIVTLVKYFVPPDTFNYSYPFLLIVITIIGSLIIDQFVLEKIEKIRQARVANAS